ncbi:MAG: TIGR00282 family metallophosphoesterase [Candidatus Auribacterota bacterium]|jgi:metallophosphoesterase (TIGR00282 family)|uniref:TIGR00282 family metallophosphoesterase n=1 Tax=Candidatus Auribacter fodinae TaxID=2093366 RepID=A0A3A4RD82_9BACT|nr:MAG: TIGR00282 family metallophosphoesterase [Candidatus Auribacter fodinae]
MKILFIGDVVGKPGRTVIKDLLPSLKDEFQLDVCIANAENSAGGSGITAQAVDELNMAGIDVITSGDHIWRNKDIFQIINHRATILRPANFPTATPGNASCVITTSKGIRVGVVNVLGRVFMKPILDCPFRAMQAELAEIREKTKIIIVDFHAEATSEKIAMGWYLDGQVSAIVGTHTHIPTADNKILPKGTAYITDVGMVGAQKSVLGRDIEPVLKHFVTGLPSRFTVATEQVCIQGVIIDIDEKTGKARSITRLERGYNV